MQLIFGYLMSSTLLLSAISYIKTGLPLCRRLEAECPLDMKSSFKNFCGCFIVYGVMGTALLGLVIFVRLPILDFLFLIAGLALGFLLNMKKISGNNVRGS